MNYAYLELLTVRRLSLLECLLVKAGKLACCVSVESRYYIQREYMYDS